MLQFKFIPALTRYIACLLIAGKLFAMWLASGHNATLGWLMVAAYLGSGYYLNRKILCFFDFEDTTLEETVQSKLGYLLFWPVQYLMVFWNVTLFKVLA